MPKRKPAPKGKKKAKIPKHGRSENEIRRDLGLRTFSADVAIGNNGPTMVQGRLHGNGGVPNRPRKATGGLKRLAGKHTKGGAY